MSSRSATTPGAVFISYAREDSEAVRRIADALRASGVEVWFDQNELRGGDAWDANIKKQIRECVLFMPIVSARTEARHEGYFRREWKLAAERTHDMAASRAFLLPVVLDGTAEAGAEVPEEFMRVQWTRLSNGIASAEFSERVKRLLEPRKVLDAGTQRSSTPATIDSRGEATNRTATRRAPRRGLLVNGAIAAVAIALVVLFALRKPAAVAGYDKSIAVLPFDNLSDDQATAYFTDGIHEEILTNLANIRELRVVSRTSVLEYRARKENIRQIAQKLGVTFVLQGSVRRDGSTVRVTGQLINARTDHHVWANKFDRDLTTEGVFAIQSKLAEEIAAALHAKVSPQEKKLLQDRPTENLAAYDLFLEARTLPFQRRTELLQQAVQLDPNFALAWALLAHTHGWVYFHHLDKTPDRLAKARAAIDNAARLAPEHPEVINALGRFYYFCFHDYTRALEQYERVLRVQPNNSTVLHSIAAVHRRQGRWAESVANFRRAVQLDPANRSAAVNFVGMLSMGRRYSEARAELRRLVRDYSGDSFARYRLAEIAFFETGSTRDIEAYFATPEGKEDRSAPRRWRDVTGDDSYLRDRQGADEVNPDEEWRTDSLMPALIEAAAGNIIAARQKLPDAAGLRRRLEGQPENPEIWIELGRIEAIAGNSAEALRCADKAVELYPLSIDAAGARYYERQRAFVRAWTGDVDGAIADYARLLQTPYGGLNVYVMKRSPTYFPARQDPRFQALLNDPSNKRPLF